MVDNQLPPEEPGMASGDYSTGYYRKDKSRNFREIVLEQIHKCMIEGSKQMKKGGQYMTPEGFVVTAEDQREFFINAVEMLYTSLCWTFDKTVTKKLNKLEKVYDDETKDEDLGEIPRKIRCLASKYFKKYLEREWYSPYKEQASKEGRMVEGIQSNIAPFLTQQREDERKSLYQEAMMELINLFKRKNELSGKKTIGAF